MPLHTGWLQGTKRAGGSEPPGKRESVFEENPVFPVSWLKESGEGRVRLKNFKEIILAEGPRA